MAQPADGSRQAWGPDWPRPPAPGSVQRAPCVGGGQGGGCSASMGPPSRCPTPRPPRRSRRSTRCPSGGWAAPSPGCWAGLVARGGVCDPALWDARRGKSRAPWRDDVRGRAAAPLAMGCWVTAARVPIAWSRACRRAVGTRSAGHPSGARPPCAGASGWVRRSRAPSGTTPHGRWGWTQRPLSRCQRPGRGAHCADGSPGRGVARACCAASLPCGNRPPLPKRQALTCRVAGGRRHGSYGPSRRRAGGLWSGAKRLPWSGRSSGWTSWPLTCCGVSWPQRRCRLGSCRACCAALEPSRLAPPVVRRGWLRTPLEGRRFWRRSTAPAARIVLASILIVARRGPSHDGHNRLPS